MTRPRVGLLVEKDRVAIAAIRGNGRLDLFSLEMDEALPARLAAELAARHLTTRRLRVGLDRRLVIVKPLELPRAAGRDLDRMVGFALECHVPFPAEDLRFDWRALPGKPDEPLRVLVAACEGHVLNGALRVVEGITRRVLSITVGCHDLPILLSRRLPGRRVVWAHRHGTRTDLLFLDEQGIRLSRSVPVQSADELAEEIRRSFPLVHWSGCEAVWISGDEAQAPGAASDLADLRAPVSAPPYRPAIAAVIARLPVAEHGVGLLALAAAAGRRHPALNLLPRALRPRTPSPGQWVTGGMAAVACLLGVVLLVAHGYAQHRYLRRVSDEIRRLEPEVKAIERLAADVAQQKHLLATLQSRQDGAIHPLPVLQELTQLIPADAWVQSVSMDRQGIELTGQATAASQLIPVLEASTSLEHVEFTAPVTTTQGKEQFRLRASWETPATATPRARAGGEATTRPTR